MTIATYYKISAKSSIFTNKGLNVNKPPSIEDEPISSLCEVAKLAC